MSTTDADKAFTGSIPELYDTYLVPLIFDSYADDLTRRLSSRRLRRVLEIAAGTGVVTRRMAAELPADVDIVATDLNQAMVDHANRLGTARPVEWRQADAMQLPFEEGEFDAVVCQFGAMFFPDRTRAYAEVRRVLKPGGLFLLNIWDRLEENEKALAVTDGLAAHFPHDPPRFLPRAPYGYFEPAVIERDLKQGGFEAPRLESLSFPSRAGSPRDPAMGFCMGSPQRAEIEERGSLDEAVDAVTEEVARRFGPGPVEGKTRAWVVEAEA